MKRESRFRPAPGRWLVVLALVGMVGSTVSTAPAARAQPVTSERALERLFTASEIAADWFAPTFLAQVPIERVRAVVQQLKDALGEFRSVERAGEGYVVRLARGSVPAQIALDNQGRITGLRFSPPEYADPAAALGTALDGLRALPGRVGVLVRRDGTEQAMVGERGALAVASAFKLAVLAALDDEIRAGRRRWDEVVTLRPEWKSLPGGILQDWPDGSPLTLQTLAALMISRSDNTATDALIATLGRETAERHAAGNRPLLTTREAFVLKAPDHADLLARWRAGDEAARREVLTEAARRPLPSASALAAAPPVPEVEWFFTADELCGLIERVAELPPMRINPGLADRAAWERVAYKGGSERGVLNFTHYLVGAGGARWCVAATWNGDAVDEPQFAGLVRQVLAGLR